MRVGVLTGGGDCPGLNAVIRAIVRTGVAEYGYEFTGFRDGWRGPLEGDTMTLDVPAVRGILPRGGTILGSSRTNPLADSAAAAGRSGLERIKDNLANLGVDALVAIGGEDTLGVAARLHEQGVTVVGVPKTIDNDLSATGTPCSPRRAATPSVSSPPIAISASTPRPARLSLIRSMPLRPPLPVLFSGFVRDVPRIVPPRGRMPRTACTSRGIVSPSSGPRHPSRNPTNSRPYSCTPLRTTARITAFKPGQSPPPVRTPTRMPPTIVGESRAWMAAARAEEN